MLAEGNHLTSDPPPRPVSNTWQVGAGYVQAWILGRPQRPDWNLGMALW